MKSITVMISMAIVLTLTGCGVLFGPAQPPIIITGPRGITANDDSYKIIRIKNTGSAYWRFWIKDDQQIVLYPGQSVFLKPASNFWKRQQSFWAHAYLEVSPDGRVEESTFAGEQLVSYYLMGRKWVCDTGQTIGADIALGNAPGNTRFPAPTHFSVSAPIGIAVEVR